MELTIVLAISATTGHGSTLSCSNDRQVFVKMLPYDVVKTLDIDEDATRFMEVISLLTKPSTPSLGPGLSKFATKQIKQSYVMTHFSYKCVESFYQR